EDVPRNPGDEGDERRLIDVAGAEMLGAGEIIQLVAKDSVTARGAEMEEHLGDRQQDHDCRRARKTIGACAIRARNVKWVLHSKPWTQLIILPLLEPRPSPARGRFRNHEAGLPKAMAVVNNATAFPSSILM